LLSLVLISNPAAGPAIVGVDLEPRRWSLYEWGCASSLFLR